ncbi:uncharacterized protein KZ484_019537 isoform 2-T2 [Pholidichthys leucotaenia]
MMYFPGTLYNENKIQDIEDGVYTSVSRKHYQWQLLNGHQWLPVDNDHVIETHYCQPGAKGITINTSQGKVYIDFDQLQTNSGVNVQRLSFLPQGQAEEIGWYFRDDQLWREYGSQGSSTLSSSISSRDVEQHFILNPNGTMSFTVGSTGYTLDFATMTQMNINTSLQRKVRRRPKFNFNTVGVYSTSVLPSAASSSQSGVLSYKWEFMGDGEQWTEYQAHICGFDSAAIESQYQLNSQGKLQFGIRRFSYTLDFSSMCQVNNSIGTRRSVRRTPIYGSKQNNSSGVLAQWQFQDVDGSWSDYSKSSCSISSQEIELQYKLNPSGTMRFSTRHYSYELSFSAMIQRNLVSNTVRSVRRLNQ